MKELNQSDEPIPMSKESWINGRHLNHMHLEYIVEMFRFYKWNRSICIYYEAMQNPSSIQQDKLLAIVFIVNYSENL